MSLYQRGLQISKNIIFSVFVKRATRLLGRPFAVITVLNEVADKLADKNSKDNKFKQLADAAWALIRLVRAYATGAYREISTGTIIAGLAVLLYVLSPLDIIPDFVPVLGFLDDLSLVSWFIGKFHAELGRFRDWETRQANRLPTPEPARSDRQLPAAAELGHS